MGSTQPHPESVRLLSKAIGPLPLLNRFLKRLDIERFFAETRDAHPPGAFVSDAVR